MMNRSQLYIVPLILLMAANISAQSNFNYYKKLWGKIDVHFSIIYNNEEIQIQAGDAIKCPAGENCNLSVRFDNLYLGYNEAFSKLLDKEPTLFIFEIMADGSSRTESANGLTLLTSGVKQLSVNKLGRSTSSIQYLYKITSSPTEDTPTELFFNPHISFPLKSEKFEASMIKHPFTIKQDIESLQAKHHSEKRNIAYDAIMSQLNDQPESIAKIDQFIASFPELENTKKNKLLKIKNNIIEKLNKDKPKASAQEYLNDIQFNIDNAIDNEAKKLIAEYMSFVSTGSFNHTSHTTEQVRYLDLIHFDRKNEKKLLAFQKSFPQSEFNGEIYSLLQDLIKKESIKTIGSSGAANGSYIPKDSDDDGVVDKEDNCKELFNPNQLDTDQDGKGDACDDDDDNDGTKDDDDNCPLTYNPEQLDLNENRIGDICEEQSEIEFENFHYDPLKKELSVKIKDGAINKLILIIQEIKNPTNFVRKSVPIGIERIYNFSTDTDINNLVNGYYEAIIVDAQNQKNIIKKYQSEIEINKPVINTNYTNYVFILLGLAGLYFLYQKFIKF